MYLPDLTTRTHEEWGAGTPGVRHKTPLSERWLDGIDAQADMARVPSISSRETPPGRAHARLPQLPGRAKGSLGRLQLTPMSLDMQPACEHARHMSKMVQIRNVPEALHRKLKSRAAGSGQTLSDYLLAELERLAARPTRDEMLARIHRRRRVTLKTPAAVVIREERESA
jgi:hypothetical protein